MKLLLDTHILLWAASDMLPKKAEEMIADKKNTLLFSAASIWEIVIKNGLMRPNFHVDAYMLHSGLLNSGYAEIAINSYHTLMVERLPPIHRDPFDRIIVAQAQCEKATILTSDQNIAEYPCQVVYVKRPKTSNA